MSQKSESTKSLKRLVLNNIASASLLVFFFLASALAASANTYYIDYSTGRDSNNGTSKTTPWQRAPGMAGFAGSYAHSAGDVFIFRGGVAWPVSTLPFNISNSGSSTGVHDYYGADITWFAGTSFARPILDGNYTGVTGSNLISITGSHVTIDNLEVARMLFPGGGYTLGSITQQPASDDLLIQHCYVHNWEPGAPASTFGDTDFAGGGVVLLGGDATVDSNVIGPGEGYNHDQTTNSGMCVWQGSVISNNDLSYCSDVIHGDEGDIHGNHFHSDGRPSFVPNNHSNIIFHISYNSNEAFYIYNNIVDGSWDGQYEGFFTHPCWSGSKSNSVYVFNNVMTGAAHFYEADDGLNCGSGNGAKVYFLNNTCDSGGICGTIDNTGAPLISLVVLQNNHWMAPDSYWFMNLANADLFCTNNEGGSGCGTAASIVDDASNVKAQKESQATSQGYTPANLFAPGSASGITVGHGTNLTSMCTGGTINNLCKDRLGRPRPTSGAWDVGAYQYSAASQTQLPAPATNLQVTVQ